MKETSSFGFYMQKLREDKGLTKAHIEKATGVSERTLRRIELDKVIPRIETLESMSLIFNDDLILSFIQFNSKGTELFERTKNELEEKIKQNNFSGLTEDVSMLKRIVRNVENPYYALQFEQYILLIEGVHFYRNDKNYGKSMEIFTKGILKSNEDFSINNYQNFAYSSMELRLLMNIAFAFNKIGDKDKYLEILKFILEEIDEHELIYPFVVHNLSTAYKRVENYVASIELAMAGIDYCKRKSENLMLPIFYYGKGVAEFHLNREGYKVSFKKAVIVADLTGLDHLKYYLSEKCKIHFQFEIAEEIDNFLNKV